MSLAVQWAQRRGGNSVNCRLPKTSRYAIPLLILALAASHGAWAQADDEDIGVVFHHTVSTGPSAVFLLSGDTERSSSAGADYMYRFDPKWETGVQFDISFGKGFDGFEGYSVVPVVAYSVTNRFNVFVGAGVEHGEESGENEFLARLGGEYSVFLNKEERFMLLPGAFVDFVGSESFVSIVLAVGYTF